MEIEKKRELLPDLGKVGPGDVLELTDIHGNTIPVMIVYMDTETTHFYGIVHLELGHLEYDYKGKTWWESLDDLIDVLNKTFTIERPRAKVVLS